MLVVSDGYPSGLNTEGEPAIRATRESVDTVRRRGIPIINIAVDDFHSEAIFGSTNVVKFLDISRLADGLRASWSGRCERRSRIFRSGGPCSPRQSRISRR